MTEKTMKKMLWIILYALLVSLAVAASAESTGRVYVTDGGKGDGSSAHSPMGSLADAYRKVADGGEIIIVGELTVPLNKEKTTRTAFVEPAHKGRITLKGQDASSTLRFDKVYEYHMSGETELRELTVSTGAYTNGVSIAARGYHLTMGEGLVMHSSGKVSGEVGTKIYLFGGYMSGATREGYLSSSNHLTVKSGSYWGILGFNRNINQNSTGKALMEIGGDVHTRFLIAGSTGTSSFSAPSGCEIRFIGDVSISKQISLGNQNSAVNSFDSNLVLKEGKVSFTGDYIDYNSRVKLTSLDIYVNSNSPSAVSSYGELFSGYGDREGTLRDYCTDELGGHSYVSGTCSVCSTSKDAAECTEHSFKEEKSGTILTKICERCNMKIKQTEKEGSSFGVYTYTSGKLRIQILSDGIVRIEESGNGSFTDKNTLVVSDRERFEGEHVIFDEDADTVVLSTPRFTVNLPKKDAIISDVRIYSKDGALIYDYFNTKKHGFYASLPAPVDTPDVFVLTDNGVIPPESGLTYDQSTDPDSGWTRTSSTDVYVLIPLGDSIKLRREFTEMTGSTMMSDIKALGSWYSKWTNYSAEEKLGMIELYRKKEIPLDMIVIDTEWKNTSVGGNGGNGTGYVTNDILYPNMPDFLQRANDAGVLVLFNDHTHQTSSLITSPAELKWQSEGITSLLKMGLDGWWYDRNWTYGIKSPYADVLFSTLGQVLYYDTTKKFESETKVGEYADRVLMLSNVDWIKHGHITGDPSVIGHRYGIQWTGDIYGDPLQLKREIENMVRGGYNGASPYMSSDLGGFWHNDTVTTNNFIRWMQYGAFSPVYRPHSTLSAKNEHLPWSYGYYAEAVVKDFLDMRYHLMPYYYALARENYDNGMPLMRRLDFYYPEHEESQDDTQYLIGKDILAAPFWSTQGDGQYAVPSSWLKDENGKQGLTARYYNVEKGAAKDTYFSGAPVKTENVPNVDYYWYTGSPAAGVNVDYFTARFTGSITPEYDCYIGTLADDGARVYINGKLWSDGYSSSQVKPYLNNKDVLKAGVSYEIAIEYYELAGRSVLYFVCEPVLGMNRSQREVFIPDGTWINVFTGEEITGPLTVTVTGSTSEMPLFVRRGSAIPVSKVTSPLEGADWSGISVNIYGLGDTSFTLYEDDGKTEAYTDGVYRKTDVCVKAISDDTWQIDFSGANGSFTTDYTERTVKLRVHSDTPITEGKVNGESAQILKIDADEKALPFSDEGGSRISDVYEITAHVSVADGATVLISCGSLDAVDGSVTDGAAQGDEDDTSSGALGVAAGVAAGAVIGAAAGAAVYISKKKKKDDANS